MKLALEGVGVDARRDRILEAITVAVPAASAWPSSARAARGSRRSSASRRAFSARRAGACSSMTATSRPCLRTGAPSASSSRTRPSSPPERCRQRRVRPEGGRARRAERRTRVAEALELVALAGTEERDVATLSGGEAQRVALARALATRPDASSSTSRSARSTARFGSDSRTTSARSSSAPASPSSTSPTTSARPSRWAIASRSCARAASHRWRRRRRSGHDPPTTGLRASSGCGTLPGTAIARR